MKAITAISNGGSGVSTGRVSRRQTDHHNHGSGENAEIKMYLSKLKDLVPFMPKNRKLSKLEIIQNVIDYICDLQSELETHPSSISTSTFDATTALQHSDESQDNHYMERNNNINNNISSNHQHHHYRNNSSNSNSPSSHQNHYHHHHHHVRKPLVDRSSPNTILSDSEVHQQNLINNQQLIHSHTTADKSA